MIAGGIDGAADQRPSFESASAIVLLDVSAECPEAGGERRDSIALLDAQFARATDGEGPAFRHHRSQCGECRYFVDYERHFIRIDGKAFAHPVRKSHGADRFAGALLVPREIDLDSCPAEYFKNGNARQVQAHTVDVNRGT